MFNRVHLGQSLGLTNELEQIGSSDIDTTSLDHPTHRPRTCHTANGAATVEGRTKKHIFDCDLMTGYIEFMDIWINADEPVSVGMFFSRGPDGSSNPVQ